jgi:hypothetical protein
MIDRRIIRALLPNAYELTLFIGCLIGVALVPVAEWLWVWIVLPRLL